MSDLSKIIRTIAAFPELLEAARSKRAISVHGPTASGAAVLAGALAGELGARALALCPGVEYAEEFAEDVNLLRDGLACHFPPLESLPGELPDEAIVKGRLSVLRHLVFGAAGSVGAEHLEPQAGTRMVCLSVNALLQPVPSVAELRRGTRAVSVGEAVGPAELVEWLVENGFDGVPLVTLPGQYSLRGGILDVFSHGAEHPVRIEFFGDQVDSIRTFDRNTQLSSERIQSCQITACRDPMADPSSGSESLTSYLARGDLLFIVEPEQLWQRGQELFETSEAKGLLLEPVELRKGLAQMRFVAFVSHEGDPAGPGIQVPYRHRDVFGIDIEGALDELSRVCTEYRETHLFCMSPAEEERLRTLLVDRQFAHLERIHFDRGRLNHGVLFTADGIAFIPHHRLFGRYRQRRLLRHAKEARPIETAQELQDGDLVVHVQYGIGRFRGTRIIETGGRRQEHLEIEFADDVHVYVPSDRIELVHRYIGVGGRRPALDKIHGAHWRAARRKAELAIQDLAAELLHMQALRQTQPGIAAPPDNEWQKQFEAEFPYEETEDQLRAIEHVKQDMEAQRPMDRLICGDVGYGKTEVAMRAAFKAVMGGRQAAVLVPTTVLAQQHYRTFRERAADYPVSVEMLSRFVSPAKTREVIEGLASGQVDVVIGTHRLLQKDVHFKNLGLVIIDEEQRFGVENKERFKKMRSTVDVLTMTATPIPRTLHMSLIGLKDICSLQTPPLNRQAIETHVAKFDPALLRHAILRELSREGQAFIVHNRVHTIEALAQTVRKLVPEARAEVAHGQMPEHQLAEVMENFLDGEIDVLVATTIIENGLDIPNANTLIVNRAEMLGLAEMHQLRGRVGRYIHKAYAYFFTPPDRPITPEARERLDAIQRYSALGAGFDIALRDLEIRGAGNILGPEQSGHIAAIGYTLYCRLLGRAVAALRGQPVREPPAVTINIGLDVALPESYVPTLQQRMEIYRQVSQVCELEEIREVLRGMRDRFGPPSQEAQNLLLEAEVRVLAGQAGVDSIQLKDGRLFFMLQDAEKFRLYFSRARIKPRVVGGDMAVLDAPQPREDGRAAALLLRNLLARA